MKRRLLLAATGLALVLATAAAVPGNVGVGAGGGTPGTSRNFTLVGHNPLFDRGMNAAPTIFDHFVYIGNRTDGSNSCGDFNATGPVAPVLPPTNPDGTCPHVHPGILVVDVANPASPVTVPGRTRRRLCPPSSAARGRRTGPPESADPGVHHRLSRTPDVWGGRAVAHPAAS